MRRYKHNYSNNRVQTVKMGGIYPSGKRFVLHGSTVFNGRSITGMRAEPMVNPIYSEIEIHDWIISGSLRILWEDYEDFVTGGATGEERPEPPYIEAPAVTGWPVGSLADHLGEPTGIPGYKSSAIPFRLYAMWINENIIDDQIQQKLPISFASGKDTITNTTLQNINWAKDLYTTLRPDPQLGNDVIIPIETDAPVVGTGKALGLTNGTTNYGLSVTGSSLSSDPAGLSGAISNYNSGVGGQGTSQANSSGSNKYALGVTTDSTKSGVKTDLTSATGTSVTALKLALSKMAWKVKRNLYGSQYKDLLRFMGIRYSDARLQLPSTLAYGKSTVDVTEVMQTAPGQDSYVGNIAGRGTGFNRTSRSKFYFEESSCVLFLSCLRPKTLYVNKPDLSFNFKVREDLPTPEFMHVGMVPYYKGDLFPTGTSTDNDLLGYGNMYDAFRSSFNDVAGLMKTTEASYHLGRMFANQPALNDDLLRCNPSSRIFANLSSDHFQVIVRHTWWEKNFVTPTGDPRF